MRRSSSTLVWGIVVAGLATACASGTPQVHPPTTPSTKVADFKRATLPAVPAASVNDLVNFEWAADDVKTHKNSRLTTSWMLASHAWGEGDERSGFPVAERLTSSDWVRISQGWTVGKKLKFAYRGRTYVGGVAHQIVRADSHEVLESLMDEQTIQRVLPLTQDARVVGRDHSTVQMELVQGTSFANARYTVGITRASRDALRFSLIEAHQNDVRDLLGYITATPFTKTHALVTVALGVDLGSEIKRALFQKHVQKAAVTMPAHMRRYLESRAREN